MCRSATARDKFLRQPGVNSEPARERTYVRQVVGLRVHQADETEHATMTYNSRVCLFGRHLPLALWQRCSCHLSEASLQKVVRNIELLYIGTK